MMDINMQNFVFNLNFDLPEMPIVMEADNEVQLPVLYTIDDVESARAAGYAHGFTRGIEEGFVQGELKAVTERQRHMQSAFVKIYEHLGDILEKEKNYELYLNNKILEITASIIEKLFPYYAQQYGMCELEHAIRYILSTLIDHQHIIIKLAPDAVDDMNARIDDIQERFHNKVCLQADSSLKSSECFVEWKGGGARWSQPDVMNKIQEIVDSYIQSLSKGNVL